MSPIKVHILTKRVFTKGRTLIKLILSDIRGGERKIKKNVLLLLKCISKNRNRELVSCVRDKNWFKMSAFVSCKFLIRIMSTMFFFIAGGGLFRIRWNSLPTWHDALHFPTFRRIICSFFYVYFCFIFCYFLFFFVRFPRLWH